MIVSGFASNTVHADLFCCSPDVAGGFDFFSAATAVSAANTSVGGGRSLTVPTFVWALAHAAKTTAAKYDFPEQLALWGGHVAPVATENEKVQYSERRLHDHVGGNVEIQMPDLVDPPDDGGNHVEQMRRHECHRVHNALVGDGPGHAVGP
jgi:hypothetical protein